MLSTFIILFKRFILYALCAYYCIKMSAGIVFLYLTKRDTRFWEVKDRPTPPKCMLDKELGEHRYITVNGIRLHYVEKGDKSKPLMVLVHGFPEFWYSWRHQIKEFAKDYWVVAVDMRGYNESDKPKGLAAYKIDEMIEDIRQLVNKLGREKFTLVAHDWGAVISWQYIEKHMDTVEKYIMMGAPSVKTMDILFKRSWKQFRMSWYMFFFQAPYLPEFVNRMFDMKALEQIKYKSDTITDDDIETYKYVFSKDGALTGPINYYRANITFEKRPTPNLSHYAPGLFLLGERDLYINKASAKILQKLYKNLEFKVVDKANHFCQQDNYVEVNRLMREFLSKK